MADKNSIDPLAVSSTEAARLLGISRPTLYRLIEQESFPYFRVGGRLLFSVHGLQNWIDEQAKKAVQK